MLEKVIVATPSSVFVVLYCEPWDEILGVAGVWLTRKEAEEWVQSQNTDFKYEVKEHYIFGEGIDRRGIGDRED
jgi:hypothetical protein